MIAAAAWRLGEKKKKALLGLGRQSLCGYQAKTCQNRTKRRDGMGSDPGIWQAEGAMLTPEMRWVRVVLGARVIDGSYLFAWLTWCRSWN